MYRLVELYYARKCSTQLSCLLLRKWVEWKCEKMWNSLYMCSKKGGFEAAMIIFKCLAEEKARGDKGGGS